MKLFRFRLSEFIETNYPLIITTTLLLFLLPLSLKVDFLQNDDWYYYREVEKFKNFDFALSPDIAPTFYLQGFLGVVFSSLFPLKSLPTLTLLVSVLNFYLFYLLTYRYLVESKLLSIFLALLFFINPLHSYSIWGFMTENYFLMFVLLGLYFFLECLEKDLSLLKPNLVLLAGFFVRQLSLVFYVASALYFLLKGQLRKFFTQLLWFFGLFAFYQSIFPKTNEMISKGLQFQHLLDSEYVFSVIHGSLIYLVAFALPVVSYLLLKFVVSNRRNYIKLFIFLALSFAIYKVTANIFDPEIISWGEFPYFENIFERTGFYPRSLHGTKYQFRGIYDFYYYWDLSARVLLASLISFVLLQFKKLFKKQTLFFLTFIGCYLSACVLAPTFFDRYISVAVPVFIFFIVSCFRNYKIDNYKFAAILIPFVFLFSFIFYTFSCDFILVELYVWNTGRSLVKEGIPANQILSSSAWNEKYFKGQDILYMFSYDTFEVNPELKERFDLVEKYVVNYPLNIHVNPTVYLYEIKPTLK